MYAQVKFTLPAQRTSLLIPTSSLVIDHSGMHFVTVQNDEKIHFIRGDRARHGHAHRGLEWHPGFGHTRGKSQRYLA
jgi:hypothetical protein